MTLLRLNDHGRALIVRLKGVDLPHGTCGSLRPNGIELHRVALGVAARHKRPIDFNRFCDEVANG